jgi:hypothetical protein
MFPEVVLGVFPEKVPVPVPEGYYPDLSPRLNRYFEILLTLPLEGALALNEKASPPGSL